MSQQHYLLPTRVVHIGVVALVLSILGNGLGLVFNFVTTVHKRNISPPTHLSNGKLARLPIEVRTVALMTEQSDRFGLNASADWASVLPPENGFVKLGEKGDEYYIISMFHQLHCLNSFRWTLMNNRSQIRDEHFLHCLRYMREMVLCAGDTTLEPGFLVTNTDGTKTAAAYGEGVTHQCRDWEQIREFTEENVKVWQEEYHKTVGKTIPQ